MPLALLAFAAVVWWLVKTPTGEASAPVGFQWPTPSSARTPQIGELSDAELHYPLSTGELLALQLMLLRLGYLPASYRPTSNPVFSQGTTMAYAMDRFLSDYYPQWVQIHFMYATPEQAYSSRAAFMKTTEVYNWVFGGAPQPFTAGLPGEV